LAEIARSPEEAMAGAMANQPVVQQQAPTDVESFQSFASAIAKVSPSVRLKLAQQLKKAGLYRGKPSSKFNTSLYDALLSAEERRAKLASVTEVPGRVDFIASLATEGEGGEGGPTKTIATSISDEGTLRSMAIEVIKAQTGYEGTKKEIDDLVKKVQKKQAKNPKVTTYQTKDGVTTSKTTGGFDEGQYMIDIISQTDDAKANKVLKADNISLAAFGGLR